MSDDKGNTGGQDRTRIDIHQDYELQDWADKFGVSKDELRQAVSAVGDRADRVESYLQSRR